MCQRDRFTFGAVRRRRAFGLGDILCVCVRANPSQQPDGLCAAVVLGRQDVELVTKIRSRTSVPLQTSYSRSIDYERCGLKLY